MLYHSTPLNSGAINSDTRDLPVRLPWAEEVRAQHTARLIAINEHAEMDLPVVAVAVRWAALPGVPVVRLEAKIADAHRYYADLWPRLHLGQMAILRAEYSAESGALLGVFELGRAFLRAVTPAGATAIVYAESRSRRTWHVPRRVMLAGLRKTWEAEGMHGRIIPWLRPGDAALDPQAPSMPRPVRAVQMVASATADSLTLQ
jgi:hypothetical protein